MFNKLDLNGIPNRNINNLDKENRYILIEEQSKFIVDKLRECYSVAEWYTATEYLGIMNPEQNKIIGDIIGIRKNKGNMKPDIFIDIKVSSYNTNENYFCNMTIDSIINFELKQFNRYYFLINSNGSDFIIISCKDIYNLLINKTTKCLIESKYRNGIEDKYNRFINRYIYKKNLEGVSGKDFIPGSFLRKYNKKY